MVVGRVPLAVADMRLLEYVDRVAHVVRELLDFLFESNITIRGSFNGYLDPIDSFDATDL